ncbi:MAG: hypothetical protein BroJett014_03880 [Planctomycetota bacterium]|nr:hypothetical protein [Planctomycetota bacterium]GIK51415.1 MAG: hypothetical protein BroJett014_03880 [Planctomycetota bacterium]
MPEQYCAPDVINGPDGNYVILAELGDGGQANAYLARDPRGNKVCLKVLTLPNSEQANSQLDYARRLDQAAKTPGWEHARAHVIAPHSYFVSGDHFLVEQYANGNTLAHYLKPDNRIAYAVARPAAKAITVALMLVELAGLAHRDVNPNNIAFRNSPAEAALIDFGLASPLLRAPKFPGFTPGYAPPEQYQNAPASTACDVYSLGATLYHALTGAPPFPTTPTPVFHGQRWNAEHAKALVDSGIPPAVIALIERMLAYEPHDRPSLREVFKNL